MRRVLWEYHRIVVHAYPAMLYVGLVFGVTGGNYVAKLARMDSTRVYVATLLLTVPALAGARLLFVASHWKVYRRSPERIWRPDEGGAALYGGLLLAFSISVPLLPAMGLGFWAFWDVATFTILIGMVFTKIGCLLNGCCAGRPSAGALALYLPDHHGVWARRIPSQLLETGWGALLLLGASVGWRHAPFDGALFLSAAAGYGLGRVPLESTRETIDRVGSVSLNRAISWSLAALSFATLLALWLGTRPVR